MSDNGSQAQIWQVVNQFRDKMSEFDKKLTIQDTKIKFIEETHLVNITEQLRGIDARLGRDINEVGLNQKEMRSELKGMIKEMGDKFSQDLRALIEEHHTRKGAVGMAKLLPTLISTTIGIVVGALSIYAALQ